jgi:homoserine/homoserine lactone efflux protein
VAYLIYLGIGHWRAAAADLNEASGEGKLSARMFGRGILVPLSNPKTLLFYGAFFPQFITPGTDVGSQSWCSFR